MQHVDGPEIVEDGVTGLLCDPYDPASIANAVVRLLRDKDLRHQLGAQARDRARQALECWLHDGIETAMNTYNG